MKEYNQFLEKLEHKNRLKNILNDDINDKLLSNKARNASLNSLLSRHPDIKDNINKIRIKYGYSGDILDHQNIHHQISQLKNKYIKNNSNIYKINNVNIISYTNNNQNKDNYISNNRNHSYDLEKNKKNLSLPPKANNIRNFEKEKTNFSLSSEQLINNQISNSNMNLSDNIDKKVKNMNYQKFIKNTRNEYNKIEQKIKEILEDEYLSPEKINKFNNIYPISKRINILTDIKKEINIMNKNNENNNVNNLNNNSFFSQLSYGSFTTIGFNNIKPKVKRPSIYEEVFNVSKLFSNNEISKNNELERPVLIKNLSKPNVNLLHFPSFCKMDKLK